MFRRQLARHTTELIILALLIPLAIILGAILWRAPAPPMSTLEPIAITAAPTQSIVETQDSQVSLQIVHDGKTAEHALALPQAEETVANVLARAAEAELISLSTTDYGGSLGLFIEELNGVRNDPAQRLYWHLYINGQRSPLGASSAVVKEGDVIKWSYEKEHAE